MNLTLPVVNLGDNDCISLHTLLFNSLYRWILPKYQRIYVWREDNVKKLLNSIKDSLENNLWMGSLLLATTTNKSYNYLQIIDGQQRILTFVLIWCILTEEKITFSIASISRIWANFWRGVQYNNKDTIYFADIVSYCKHHNSNNESLNKIIDIVKKFKEKETDVLSRVITFLKNKLYVTPLHIKSGQYYDYFEHTNSTNVTLTLPEKGFALIVSEYEVEKNSNHLEILRCWLAYPRKKEKHMLIEYFIKIFNDKDVEKGSDLFDVFKKMGKSKIGENFFKFLAIYHEQRQAVISNKNQNFYEYYLYKISWKNYWPIIVILKFKQFDNIFDYLLNNLWKIDLWTYCVGEVNQQSSDTLYVAKEILQNDDQHQVKKHLQEFLKNKRIKLVSPLPQDNEILRFSKRDLESICYDKKNTKRLKIFFWLLLSANSSEELMRNMKHKSCIKEFVNRDWQVEHIVAQETRKDISVRDKNMLKNLMLVAGWFNKLISNKPLSEKIEYYKKGIQYIYQYRLYSWIEHLDKSTDDLHYKIWSSNEKLYREKFDQNLKDIWKWNILI